MLSDSDFALGVAVGFGLLAGLTALLGHRAWTVALLLAAICGAIGSYAGWF
jgi:hypothetical protein